MATRSDDPAVELFLQLMDIGEDNKTQVVKKSKIKLIDKFLIAEYDQGLKDGEQCASDFMQDELEEAREAGLQQGRQEILDQWHAEFED